MTNGLDEFGRRRLRAGIRLVSSSRPGWVGTLLDDEHNSHTVVMVEWVKAYPEGYAKELRWESSADLEPLV